MNKVNYQKELNKLLENKDNYGKRLLLHSCCAPCSSYVLTYLCTYFRITVFYYNPNITGEEEYNLRVSEQKRLIDELNKEALIYPWAYKAIDDTLTKFKIDFINAEHIAKDFYDVSRGLENVKEGGRRCANCFELRLRKSYEMAKELKADYFGTTLTISPLKNAELINMIGLKIQNEDESNSDGKNDHFAPMWMLSDFKKNEGYKHSIELSAKYGLYRQDFCGCEYSRRETL